MKKIGMLVAVEMDAVLSRYGNTCQKMEYPGYTVLAYQNDTYTIYALHTGAGEIAAAAGTQFLIDVLKVDMILNFGVVGGLTPEMSAAKVCVVESVVHYDWDCRDWLGLETGHYPDYPNARIPTTPALVKRAMELKPELKKVVCASADKFVGSPEQKVGLHILFGADICEMEAAGVVITCNRNRIPCLLIKAVSDGIEDGAQGFFREVERVSAACLEIADQIIREL